MPSIIDMHIHVKDRSPCSVLDKRELFDNLSPRLDGICITDHWVLKSMKQFWSNEIKVFFGVEITCDLGDILAFGITSVPSKEMKARNVIRLIHNQGGIAVCAHPFSTRHFAFGERVYEFDFDAIEINGAMDKTANELAKQAAMEMNLPTVAGSDSHSKSQLNTLATYYEEEINSITDLVESIKAKDCKVIQV